MIIFLIVLGIIFITAGTVWLILFNIRKRKLIKNYANSGLLEYRDEDIVPEEVAKKFISDGIEIIFKKVLLNVLIPAIVIMCGILAILFAANLSK